MYRQEDAEVGSPWRKAQRKTKEEVYGCSQRGHKVSWVKKRGCGGHGYTEADDWPWPLLKGAVERKEKEIYSRLTETWITLNILHCQWQISCKKKKE